MPAYAAAFDRFPWQPNHLPTKSWIAQVPLTKLVHELTEAAGASRRFIAGLTQVEGFVAMERGEQLLTVNKAAEFSLDVQICRMPLFSFGQRWSRRARWLAHRLQATLPGGDHPPAPTSPPTFAR